MLVGFIFTLLILLDCVAINIISKDELSTTKQKVLQTLLVFFVPLLGALLVIFVNKAKPSSTGKYAKNANLDAGDVNLRVRNKNENEFEVNDD
jgi:Na+-transporting methylmalonyl-CoA/oxaloacetate decarboxylase gamma subunit